MSQDSKDLTVILADQFKREQTPTLSDQLVSEIKSSQSFQISWEQLLQAAPVAVSSIGACLLASSSPKAIVNLTPPEGKGFQYLSHEGHSAHVMAIQKDPALRMGVKSFQRLTDYKLNRGQTNEIIDAMVDPSSAKRMLPSQLKTLLQDADTCFNASVEMDKKFTD